MMLTTVRRTPVDDRPDDHRADFESWMAARQGRLLRTAYLLTGDVHAAEDLVQTALAKLYLAWDRVAAAPSVDAYARKILVNEHTSMWRRLWRHREVVSDTSTHDVPVPGEEYDGVSSALWTAVRALPERQRAVVVLRYYEQLSERETADALGITVGTVKSQASRALGALREHLSDSWGDRDDLSGWEAHR
jgi:RNA polymerase sigma-70 factor (sigma-E family)